MNSSTNSGHDILSSSADVFTNDDPESIYWLGLRQEPGKGYWAWVEENGMRSYADLDYDNWVDDIYYGSSLVDTPQVGIFYPAAGKGDGEVGLTNILDYSDPPIYSIEAGVICEDVKSECSNNVYLIMYVSGVHKYGYWDGLRMDKSNAKYYYNKPISL